MRKSLCIEAVFTLVVLVRGNLLRRVFEVIAGYKRASTATPGLSNPAVKPVRGVPPDALSSPAEGECATPALGNCAKNAQLGADLVSHKPGDALDQGVADTGLVSRVVARSVAVRADRDRVVHRVRAALGERLDVVHLEERDAGAGEEGSRLRAALALATALGHHIGNYRRRPAKPRRHRSRLCRSGGVADRRALEGGFLQGETHASAGRPDRRSARSRRAQDLRARRRGSRAARGRRPRHWPAACIPR